MDEKAGKIPGDLLGFLRRAYPLCLILIVPAVLFALTLDKYYGYYYDNKFFNLLALDLLEDFKVYLYLGSHYHVPSTLFSYFSYLLFLVLGPGDLAIELLATVFHLLTVCVCYRLGTDFHGRSTGIVFAILVAIAPILLIQVYTLPDLSFAVFLNITSVYLFLTGLKKLSPSTLVLAAVTYSIGCFQAIYSLMLFPFYIASLVLWRQENRTAAVKLSKAAVKWCTIVFLPSYTYLFLLFKATFMKTAPVMLTLALLSFALISVRFIKKIGGGRAFLLVFPGVAIALLACFDLIVQIDYAFFGHEFGYFIEASPAGGYGGRPHTHFMGQGVRVLGFQLYSSVLTSMFEFVGGDFAKVSMDFEPLRSLYSAYFLNSYPAFLRLLFYAGVASLLLESFNSLRKGEGLKLFSVYPLIWLGAALMPLVNLGPDYFNIRRIYIPPLPYLFAAFGAAWIASLAGSVAKGLNSRTVYAAVLSVIVLLASCEQAWFSLDNIYLKYLSDKETSMYFKLFYGHYYGRSYKEAGEFLLKDAPLKKDGKYRAALVYTIPEDSRIGRSLPLFNTIDWYTKRQIRVIFDFKDKSRELYGTRDRLSAYLEGLFSKEPTLEAVYFADFIDDGGNFSYFSGAHRWIRPYAVINDDGTQNFDCKLFRFTRQGWKLSLDGKPG